MALAGLLVLSMSVALGISGSVSAFAVTIEPNSWHIASAPGMLVMEPFDRISFTWSSDLPLKLSVSAPSGLIKTYDPATSGSGTLDADEGVLYFPWLNSNSVNASLEYEFVAESVGERFAISVFALIVAVVAAVVIGLVVAVLLVVRSMDRSSSSAPPGTSDSLGPPGPYQGYSGSRMEVCPGCGSKVNPSTRVCPGCGARVL